MNARHLCLLAVLQAVTLPAAPAHWAGNPARSAIRVSGVQVGVPFPGRVERFKADIDFDPAKPEAGRALVLVDLASARTGDVQRDEALPQKDWFDVRAASEARRRRRSTSGSHHSRVVPPGRSSPRTSVPADSSRSRTGVKSSA